MSENTTDHGSRITDHDAADGEISLLDIAIVLAKHKKLILALPFAAAVVAAGISLLLPNIYTGVTRVLPPQQNQSTAAAMLNQLGSLAGVAGQSLGIKNPNDLYIGMLRSRTVADKLIGRFELKKFYETKTADETRRSLESNTKITAGKDGIIVIAFDDEDPKRAATIANAYVEELYKLTQTLAVTEASQRRLFFESQLAQTRRALASAEVAARKGLEQGGIVKVDDQGRSMVETTGRLRGQIAVKEIQIGAMRTFAAEGNPELRQAQNELTAMKQELAKIEGIVSGREGASGLSKTEGMENLGLLRDVKYYETIFELLARQYEIAKIDEAKDASLIQVLDKAIEPERKSKPKRALIVILTALVAGFLALLWAFMREASEKSRQDPQQAERLNLLRHYISGK